MTTPTPDRPTQPPAVPDALRQQWHKEWLVSADYDDQRGSSRTDRHMHCMLNRRGAGSIQ